MMSAFSLPCAVSRIFCAGTIDAEVDDLVIVALEHDADDVLADVVHVALHRGEHDLALQARLARAASSAFSFSMKGMQIGDRLLHHAGRLHHLRQEHLA